jgi:hypothetical protein
MPDIAKPLKGFSGVIELVNKITIKTLLEQFMQLTRG